ncbi:hypothetical protein [Haloechinothrix halophila]|uniref:hypothetical protein n=1 Tax=Haloechinothrix halophila TaxID=1069073 RepID=UPI0005519C98|nr:hypothetical protein [Haloechinothrix halophila]
MPNLIALDYVLGEIAEPYDAVENWQHRAERLRMAPDPELWGWGEVRRSARSCAQLAVETGQATLDRAGVHGSDVDELYLCSTAFSPSLADQSAFVAEVTSGLGLRHAAVTGVTLGRCTNLLLAVRAACAAIAARQCGVALVITADRISGDAERLESFALFSDGAASCLVVPSDGGDPSGEHGGFRVEGSAVSQDLCANGVGEQISAELAIAVNKRIEDATSVSPGDIAGVMHNNLYIPLVTLKESQAGFRSDQLFLANIARFGHCFAADPLINLVDRYRASELVDGERYLLASSVPGMRAGVLVRYRAPVHTTS